MKLEYLKLTNFRGFREFEITFDPSFTVLLGGNMAGKSAVLDGAAIALSAFFRSSARMPLRNIEDNEIYQTVVKLNGIPNLAPRFPVVVEAHIAFAGPETKPSMWRLSRGEENTETHPDVPVNGALKMFPQGKHPTDLPIIAQYGTQRHWHGSHTTEDVRGIGSRYDGYTGCFDIASTHAALAGWMRKQTLVQLQQGNGYVQPQLVAVESAVKCCIEGLNRIWFDVQYDELRLELTDGDIQSFAMLSEGVRNMVAMVADISWRAAVLNPQYGSEAHSLTEGVVLIDELDLHLHPRWQRHIVADLCRTFPKVQFIVTTHSPQIVASVSRKQIRLLDRNRLVADAPYVEGRDSSEILEDVFGVPARPEAIKAEIDELYQLIEDTKFTAARARLARLEERLGPDDAAMVRARWILDTEDAESNAPPASPT